MAHNILSLNKMGGGRRKERVWSSKTRTTISAEYDAEKLFVIQNVSKHTHLGVQRIPVVFSVLKSLIFFQLLIKSRVTHTEGKQTVLEALLPLDCHCNHLKCIVADVVLKVCIKCNAMES